MSEELHEECGVFGIYSPVGTEVSSQVYYGLTALQHRGQEACGIAVCDTSGSFGNITYHKAPGLVSEVFSKETLDTLKGNIAVGHVRYSTTGASVAENAQPHVMNYIKGTLALVHNGNLVNTETLRNQLAMHGMVFRTTTDSEVIACCVARERATSSSAEEAVLKTMRQIRGAYGLIIMSPRKLIGIRDPYGLKPLCLGKKENSWVLASESCALNAIGAEFVRDLQPGEILTIGKDGLHSNLDLVQKKKAHCIFEYIYFARLDSQIDGIKVYDARIRSGEALYKRYPIEADLVTGVPESGLPAAIGYAKASGQPFGMAFYKNSYIGRTFIKPTQEEREISVKQKLSILEPVVAGKRIVLIDDSIVRGTTIAGLIKMLKKAGAKEVHVLISSPPFLHPCYFGTDVPSNRQLIAFDHSPEEICAMIGADSLGYLALEDFREMVGGLPLCTACFNGEYPMNVTDTNE